MRLSSNYFVSSEVISHVVLSEENCNDVLNPPVNLKKFPTEPEVPRSEEIFTCPELDDYEHRVSDTDPNFNKPPDDSYKCPTVNTDRKFRSSENVGADQERWKDAEQDRRSRRRSSRR